MYQGSGNQLDEMEQNSITQANQGPPAFLVGTVKEMLLWDWIDYPELIKGKVEIFPYPNDR